MTNLLKKTKIDKPLETFSLLLIFLYPSTLLIHGKSYSWISILLLITGLLSIAKTRQQLKNRDGVLLFYAAAISYFAVIVASWLVFDGPSKQLDIANRVIFFLPALALILFVKPSKVIVLVSLSVGAIISGLAAVIMQFVLNVRPFEAFGFMPIQSSGMAASLAVFSLVTAFEGRSTYNRHLSWLGIIGFLLGATAVLLCGSKGAFIPLPFVLFIVFWFFKHSLSRKFIAVQSILFLSVAFLSGDLLSSRVSSAYSDFVERTEGTSTGVRLELWKAAYLVGKDNVLFGVGRNNVIPEKQKLYEQGLVGEDAIKYGNAHNQYLDAFQERGLIGLFSILIMCLVPIYLFFKLDIKRNCFALMGICHMLLLMGYFLTQTYLNHHSGMLFYTVFLAIFAGMAILTAEENQKSLQSISEKSTS